MSRPTRAFAPCVSSPSRRRAAAAWLHGLVLSAVVLTAGPACGPQPEPSNRLGTTTQAVRPDTPGGDALWRYDPSDTVESYDSPEGHFRIHYTTEGRHRVSPIDQDGNGVPDRVEFVAATYEAVLATYVGDGFRPPLSDADLSLPNGGDGRFDVYLVDFGGAADGAFQVDACLDDGTDRCIGYMVQENDFAGYRYPSFEVATRILASHEFFHAVQAAYDADQGPVFGEGTAVWATEFFDPSLDDFEGFISGYLDHIDRSLDVPPPGPVQPFTYGASIFFWYLHERYGPTAVRELWEAVENGHGRPGGDDDPADPDWYSQLDLWLADVHGSSFAEAWSEFTEWLLLTGPADDPSRAWADARAYPRPPFESPELPYEGTGLRIFHASAHYYAFTPGAPETLRVVLVDPTDDGDDDLAGLVLHTAVERDGAVGPISTRAAADGPVDVEVGSGETFLLVVANTQRTGQSRKPVLCVGAPDAADACATAHAAGSAGDAGTPDGGRSDGGADAGSGGGGDGTTGGCGCAATSRGRPPPWALLLLALGLTRGISGRSRSRRPPAIRGLDPRG
ncbi:MAG: hypothetical protein D6729_16040 [Deltaproteobacteria bacterium]|nr:MAG: hypothetical protein D6729_16040 [Deltaproteobacteria bacterium]